MPTNDEQERDEMSGNPPTSGYAPVNGLRLYYEIHGSGQPLVVLHGSFITIELMGGLVPGLAQTRQVIAVEMQGHGHTADSGRPFSLESLAHDVAALIAHVGLGRADVCGYSLGGGVAWQLAIRHPSVVRKLVVISAPISSDGYYPEVLPGIAQVSPEMFDGTPWREAYNRVAPDPDAFGALVENVARLDMQPFTWPEDAVRAIPAPTMIVIGDSDGIRPEHAVEMFRLRGGGVFGDMAGLPAAQFAVIPGTTHVGLLDRADLLVAMIVPFLDAPPPAKA